MIFHEIHLEGIELSETFQVASIIEKLSSGRKDFKNYLKHKQKEMNIEELIVRLRIEEYNWSSDRRMFTLVTVKVNMIEHGQNLKPHS